MTQRARWVLWGLLCFVLNSAIANEEPPPVPRSCPEHLAALAREGAQKIFPKWRFIQRRKLARAIQEKIETQYRPLDTQTRERIELAVAHELADYERKIAQGMPPRA